MIGHLEEGYYKLLRDAVEKRAEYISAGKCQSHEEYKSKCGEIAGLKEALGIFKDVVKSHGEIDDDD